MQTPAYSRVLSGGRVCGKSPACTCLAISSSWAARRSDSSLSARARRCASTAWVTSSKLTSEKELPSRSLKRVKTPPQIGAWSALGACGSADCAVRTCTSYLRRFRRGGYPATAGLNAGVKDQLKAELIEVKAEALLEIADENHNRLEAQVGVLAIQANSGAVYRFARRVAHGQDYKAECDSSACNS